MKHTLTSNATATSFQLIFYSLLFLESSPLFSVPVQHIILIEASVI